VLFAELRSTLKTVVAPAYILSGSDIFLINKSIELILQAAAVTPMNVTKFDETADPAEVDATLRNVSMFGDKTAAIIRGTQDTRVLLQPGTKDRDAVRVDCNPMTADLVVRLIMNTKRFTADAAALLAGACENNYARVNNEIIKLTNHYHNNSVIQRADVDAIVTKTESYQVYELSNALLKKDAAAAEKILQNLQNSGVEDYAIFGNLVSFARRLFYALHSPLSDSALAAHLKGHPYGITATRRDGRHLRDRIMTIYSHALELEHRIKSGKIHAQHAIVLLAGAFL